MLEPKKPMLLFIVVMFMAACQTKVKVAGNAIFPSFQIEEHRAQFPHSNLKKFDESIITDFSIDSPIYRKYHAIMGGLALEVYQDTSMVRDFEDETTKVLYPVQQEDGHQGILIAGGDDDWVSRILYYSYDLKGKLIDKLSLYEVGGDGGYSTYTTGEFINDTVYVRKSIYCEPVDDKFERMRCDTVLNKFCIHKNGRIGEWTR